MVSAAQQGSPREHRDSVLVPRWTFSNQYPLSHAMAGSVTPSRTPCLYFPITCVQGQTLAPAGWEISCQEMELTTVKSTLIGEEVNVHRVIKTSELWPGDLDPRALWGGGTRRRPCSKVQADVSVLLLGAVV